MAVPNWRNKQALGISIFVMWYIQHCTVLQPQLVLMSVDSLDATLVSTGDSMTGIQFTAIWCHDLHEQLDKSQIPLKIDQKYLTQCPCHARVWFIFYPPDYVLSLACSAHFHPYRCPASNQGRRYAWLGHPQ